MFILAFLVVVVFVLNVPAFLKVIGFEEDLIAKAAFYTKILLINVFGFGVF